MPPYFSLQDWYESGNSCPTGLTFSTIFSQLLHFSPNHFKPATAPRGFLQNNCKGLASPLVYLR
jgi:hypothetical protein